MTPHRFIETIREYGLAPPSAIEPGRFVRFPGNGKAGGNRAGWAYLFPDGLGGCLGDWTSGLSETWKAERGRPLTGAEKEAFRRKVAEAKALAETARAKQHIEAVRRATNIWKNAKPAPSNHSYLVAKGVKPHGLRLHDNCLVIPLRDSQEKLWSLQFIGPEGTKRFLTDGRKRSCYFAIGKPDRMLCICEGYASGASIHETTGYAVAVAFDAGNLLPVAQALREKFPVLRLIICADNDIKGDENEYRD